MRKRNKLYTANRWNQPLFAKGMDRDNYNILDGMLQSSLNTSSLNSGGFRLSSAPAWYSTPQLAKPSTQMPVDWSDGVQSAKAVGNSAAMVSNFGKEADNNNPFKQIGSKSGNNFGSMASTIGGGLLSSSIADKALDTFDPVFHLAGGRESAVGNGLSEAGKNVFKASAMSGNGWGMLAGAGLKIVGGLTNAAFGIKTDKQALNAAKNGIDYYGNFKSDATDFDDVTGVQNIYSFRNPYKGGWFSGGKARRKNQKLKNEFIQAESWANRSVDNNIDNIADTQMDTLMANYSAFGGLLGSQGAIDYGFMSDYLTAKNKAASVKDKMGNNIFGSLANPTFFALGGDVQTNGSDFSTGLVSIDAGGSHEENPYQGVQLGISMENGQPNLVEEGETVFDDYVFSKRIKADAQARKRFHLGKNANLSYADISKKLEKESLERPNDPISEAGLTKQLHALAEEQERQKQEQKEKEAQEMFNSLPPEQQQEILQQMAMQEQAAQQQQAAQEQPIQEEQAQQMPQQGMEEQPMQQDGQQVGGEQMQQQPQMEQPMEEEPQMNACGGKINRYDKGGDLKKKIYNYLGLYTDSDFNRWADEHKLPKVTDWENVLKNKQFMETLSGANPALADAISRGYDFGAYTYTPNNKLTFDFKHGGWGLEDYNAWNGSEDAAWKEAVDKGLVKEGMNSEEIGNALMQTDSYKRGSDWLKASDANRLTYLQSILNSEDAPQAARDYAARFVDKNGWLKDAKTDYQTIFEDPNGTGVRNTHPGTYWKTPNEILRDKVNTNYVVNDDGTVEEIYGDVPKDWTNVGSYTWQTDKSDNGANYFKRPVTANSQDAKGNGNPSNEEYEPVHKPTWGRYAGLAGPLVGLGMQAAGIGKPDYSRLDASVEAASGAPALAHYKPIGNYLTYRPMDIWFEQNRMDANSRATDRAILNNASPTGTKMAGLLASGYNSQIADGNLYRQALEYNDAQRQKVAEFNRGTDMFNADAFTKTSATNAELQNRNRQFKAQMAMDAAKQRMASDAAWNQGIYGNVSGLFKGLSDWGKENEQHNMIADMAADGLFGTMSDKQNIGKGYIVRKKTKKANGGRLNRRRGLTF